MAIHSRQKLPRFPRSSARIASHFTFLRTPGVFPGLCGTAGSKTARGGGGGGAHLAEVGGGTRTVRLRKWATARRGVARIVTDAVPANSPGPRQKGNASRLPATPPTAHRPPSTVHRPPPSPPPTVHHPPSTVRRPPPSPPPARPPSTDQPTVHRPPPSPPPARPPFTAQSAAHRPPSIVHRLPSTVYRPPAVYHPPSTTRRSAPHTDPAGPVPSTNHPVPRRTKACGTSSTESGLIPRSFVQCRTCSSLRRGGSVTVS